MRGVTFTTLVSLSLSSPTSCVSSFISPNSSTFGDPIALSDSLLAVPLSTTEKAFLPPPAQVVLNFWDPGMSSAHRQVRVQSMCALCSLLIVFANRVPISSSLLPTMSTYHNVGQNRFARKMRANGKTPQRRGSKERRRKHYGENATDLIA